MIANPSAESGTRDRKVQRILLVEGSVNLTLMIAKAVVGLSTGAVALLADAVHSLSDLANNFVALVAARLAGAPPDREHPYGHRKFETLAVFGLASLLIVLAIETVLRAIQFGDRTVVRHGWGLGVMIGVLAANILLTLWESRWARRLDSDLLRADARHTLADVLTTAVVIAGWQFAALGRAWLDTLATLGVALVIFWLAYGLLRRVVPVLVDEVAEDPEAVADAVQSVPGVHATRRVRSRGSGTGKAIDVVVAVAPDIPTAQSHAIADAIVVLLQERFSAVDITVHVEPDN